MGEGVGCSVGETVGDTVVGEVVGDQVVGEVVGDSVRETVLGEVVGDPVGEAVVGDTVVESLGVDTEGEVVGDSVVGEVVGGTVSEVSPSCSSSSSSSLSASSPAGTLTCQHAQPCHLSARARYGVRFSPVIQGGGVCPCRVSPPAHTGSTVCVAPLTNHTRSDSTEKRALPEPYIARTRFMPLLNAAGCHSESSDGTHTSGAKA